MKAQPDLLILLPKYYYECKMSMVRRRVVDAQLRRTDINAVLSGQGWGPGELAAAYSSGLSLRENIQRIMPQADAVFWYKPQGGQKDNVPPLIQPQERGDVKAIVSYNEAWWPEQRALQECWDTNTDLIVHHHANDAEQFQDRSGGHKVMWTCHIPHCADESLFGPWRKRWADRAIDVVLTGVDSPEIYPLRHRLMRLARSWQGLNVASRPHPGYRLRSLADCREQERDYARTLGNSKVALVTPSKYNYLLAKYQEAMAAGCALAGGVPDDADFKQRRCMYTISADDSDAEIERAVRHLVANGEPLSRRSMAAYWAYYTVDHYCDRLIRALKTLLRDKRSG